MMLYMYVCMHAAVPAAYRALSVIVQLCIERLNSMVCKSHLAYLWITWTVITRSHGSPVV